MAQLRSAFGVSVVLVLVGVGCGEDGGTGSGVSADPPAGYAPLTSLAGDFSVPDLPTGQPADLTLLEAREREVVAAADERAATLRSREVELWFWAPGTEVEVTQLSHHFELGVAIHLGRFESDEELEWYSTEAAKSFNFAVTESSSKWGVIEPEPGARDYARTDAIVEWGAEWGLELKGHTLLWGNAPPLSSTGIPEWVLERFPSKDLSSSERDELRELLRSFVTDTLQRHPDSIGSWDITNETLQPFAQWFIERLGPELVDDIFRWAEAAAPDTERVMNEWVTEVFTSISGPSAAEVRDRVLELRSQGTPIDALGIQGHFVPGQAYIGLPADFSQRTLLDEYQRTLDTLGEAGLPVHITELNVIAPEQPALRAAQQEGIMRLLWGHPAVTQIGFWSLWNQVSGKADYDPGLYDEARQLTPHGAAAFSLLNDRWRTNLTQAVPADQRLAFRAVYGDYVVRWSEDGEARHALFEVRPGDGPLQLAISR